MDDDIDLGRLLRLIPRLAAHPKHGQKLIEMLECDEYLSIPVTLEDLPTFEPDPADVADGVFEEFVTQALSVFFDKIGRQVLSVGWDSDFPGGSGAVWVTEYDGIYIAASSDPCPRGPFESLEELMTEGPFQTAFGRPDIQSDVLDHDVLMALAARLIVWEDREIARVNGIAYIPKDGVLVPYEEDDDASEESEKLEKA